MIRSISSILTVMGLSFVTALPSTVAAEPESDPLCGTTVVESIVLDRDITCYNSNGLTVGAERVTIDLNGKTIQCHNGATSSCPGSRFIGIDASRVQAVAIKGPGKVVGFGVQFVAATEAMQAARRRPVVIARVPAKRAAAK